MSRVDRPWIPDVPRLADASARQPGIAVAVRPRGCGPQAGRGPELLHELFEAQADARPDAIAVVFGREQTSYARLEAQANRVARHLRGQRVGRGSVVAMLLPRSVDAYAALLGILKAGAAYLPIDAEHPAERIADILKDSDADVLMTTADMAPLHGSFGGEVIRLDADRGAIDSESAVRLPRSEHVGARQLCSVLYTSGSTGRPKGVMIEHRSACHLVRAEGEIFGVRPEDRVYQGFSLAFDASVEEIWLAFHAGATLVAATPEMARSGPDLAGLLAARGVSVLSCVPTLLAMLAEDVPTIRLLILGGESCPAALVERWVRPGRRVVNTYGPTEATVIATFAEVALGRPVAIGRPLPGYRVRVLDDELRPVPPGKRGEICIGGVGVARGYVGLSSETAARFVPDPFAPPSEPDARLYRTGDLGRVDAEGNLEFLGRTDGQVKIRGCRVELAEIESALAQEEGVLAAACALREGALGVPQLIGYVVPRPGAAVQASALRERLRRRLPAQMVPEAIEALAHLPRLPSGKLDRAALPRPRERETARSAAPPRTRLERALARIWGAIFHPKAVGIHDDFFLDLGGHAPPAARRVSELRKDPRLAGVSVTDVDEHPTIA